ncbi:glycosyltransferase family 4 protein [Clostridium perfringens]|uniref:glycosyltransferase family 4 protein n=1 Tax=Clostridium perfringens TaxID=1502 RepID=UPI0024BCAFAA|nr:glycosyltransferase family 4 protein [Clostridium perfringens]MDM0686136.1 glycosyltransferase family 4 protein [Clostridium perfringens]MDZ4996983.1 glycosyltransferase [Clostridium perfringens]
MKIVHIHQYYNDGMGYQENILPRYHKKLNNEVFLITSDLSNGFDKESRSKEKGTYYDNGIIIKRIGIYCEFKNRFVIFKDLYKELEEIRPDYIFHHSVTSPSLATVCKYKKNNLEVFLAVDNHADLNISARNNVWKILYYNIFWKRFIKKYDDLIDIYFGVTPSRCLFLNEELGVKMKKIRLLPIGADIDGIDINISREKLFEKYNIDRDNFLIVHGGKITKEKQIDRIIQAFSYINNKNINLILFGKIEDSDIERMIKKDRRIKYLGWLNRNETLAILKYSDIGIWNTQHTTLLEDAIAVGLPLILRYYGSTSHLIDNSGLFLYDGSTREIYDKLKYVVENKEIIPKLKYNTKKMAKILSYHNIAEESIKYKFSQSASFIHNKFMDKSYSDYDFRFFRRINRS